MPVNLTWDDINDNEDGHRVYRSPEPMDSENMPAPLVTLGANVTAFTDETAVAGNTYYYRVSAFNSSVERISSEVEVT